MIDDAHHISRRLLPDPSFFAIDITVCTATPTASTSVPFIMLKSLSFALIVLISLFALLKRTAVAFAPVAFTREMAISQSRFSPTAVKRPESHLNVFDKLFEEAGPLGKGVTVGKVQVALRSPERGSSSIFSVLEEEARLSDGSPDPEDLASMASSICLALLRRSDDWVAACSTSEWFKQDDAGKAESLFNDWANKEAAKFEKEYIPGPEVDFSKGDSTIVVVSLVIEIMGDTTKFDGAGFSFQGTKDVLSSIASDCMVEDGECINAVELFWTPSDREEVLLPHDMFLDFPELIEL